GEHSHAQARHRESQTMPVDDPFLESASYPIASELCVSDDKRINVILDSGAARCFARLNFIQHLAKVPGVKLTWEELPKMKGNGVTANGNPMVITHIARLVVWTTRRPHDKVTLRIHCTPQLMPDVLVGVSGLKLLRVGLIFTPDGVTGSTGLVPNQYLARVEGGLMQPYKVDTNFVATSGDPEEMEYSLFDQ
ncbi:hypothetical protein FOZ63_017617, partial [Perkinsus olseni]